MVEAQNRQKLENLNQYISVSTDNDQNWFVVFVFYPDLNAIFLF